MAKVGFGRYWDLDWTEFPASEWHYAESLMDKMRASLANGEAERERRDALKEMDLSPIEKEVHSFYRERARKAHPDAGGSHEQMIELDLRREFLLAAIRHYKEYLEAENGNR